MIRKARPVIVVFPLRRPGRARTAHHPPAAGRSWVHAACRITLDRAARRARPVTDVHLAPGLL
jgi:hypothetical protein